MVKRIIMIIAILIILATVLHIGLNSPEVPALKAQEETVETPGSDKPVSCSVKVYDQAQGEEDVGSKAFKITDIDSLIEKLTAAKEKFLDFASSKRVSADEALTYLYQQVPEFDAISAYIERASEGKAHFVVRLPDELTLVYNPDNLETIRGYYYVFYVGESFEDHTTNWDWFYVKADLTEILHENIIKAQMETMEEWRNSESYFHRAEEVDDISITDSDFIKVLDKYLITNGNQIEKISQMIANHAEIEPGIKADEVTYFLCNDVKVKDWLQMGSLKSPFKGKFIGNDHSITGYYFYIVTQGDPQSHWGKDTIIKERYNEQKTNEEISLDEIEHIFGKEGKDVIEQLLNERETTLETVKWQNFDELDSCIFTLADSDGAEYHLLLEGSWNGMEIPFHHMSFEFDSMFPTYDMTVADINFDGIDDLLIVEGYSGGTGGSFIDLHGLVWNSNINDFEDYPSFPASPSRLELNEKRVMDIWRLGWGLEGITVYGLINDQYTVIQELRLEAKLGEDHQMLYYYEMGELVRTHIITNWSEEAGQLYPELNYWRKG